MIIKIEPEVVALLEELKKSGIVKRQNEFVNSIIKSALKKELLEIELNKGIKQADNGEFSDKSIPQIIKEKENQHS